MGQELVKNQDIASVIREKLRSEFVNLIPDEAWDEMISKELKWFTEDEYRDSRYHGSTRELVPSPLKTMMRQALADLATERIKATLDTPEFNSNLWDDTEPGEAIQKIAAEVAPQVLAKLMENYVANIVTQIGAANVNHY